MLEASAKGTLHRLSHLGRKWGVPVLIRLRGSVSIRRSLQKRWVSDISACTIYDRQHLEISFGLGCPPKPQASTHLSASASILRTPTSTRPCKAMTPWVIWSWDGKPWAPCTSSTIRRPPIPCELWHRPTGAPTGEADPPKDPKKASFVAAWADIQKKWRHLVGKVAIHKQYPCWYADSLCGWVGLFPLYNEEGREPTHLIKPVMRCLAKNAAVELRCLENSGVNAVLSLHYQPTYGHIRVWSCMHRWMLYIYNIQLHARMHTYMITYRYTHHFTQTHTHT